jgi:hypothetical protein
VAHRPAELPAETLQYLLASRYCEVDLLSPAAHDLFGGIEPDWPLVQAICGWCIGRLSWAISMRGRPRRRWMLIRNGGVFAVTSSIWRFRFLPQHEYSGALRHQKPWRYRVPMAPAQVHLELRAKNCPGKDGAGAQPSLPSAPQPG